MNCFAFVLRVYCVLTIRGVNHIQEFFYKNVRASSGGYTYIAGASINNNGDYDMLLVKYQGITEIWSATWDGPSGGDDFAASIVIDGSGNVIIGGTTYIGNSVNYDAVLVKYNSSGTLQWDETYDGGSSLADGYTGLAVDGSNNVYACGGTVTTSEYTNFLTVKYNSSGTEQWDNTYDYNDLDDLAVKILVGGTTVRVSGGSQYDADEWEMTTVSYNLSTGAQGAVNQTGGDQDGIDIVTDAWTDGTYTYVVGGIASTNEYDWKIIKLDDDLQIVWETTYNGSDNLDDVANSI